MEYKTRFAPNEILDGATAGELARFFVYDPSVTAGLFVVGTG